MQLKILIVDDDRKLLSVLKTILAGEKDDVTLCYNGKNAIDMCRNSKFDLIITDLMMPGANGMEVLKESRKIDPDSLVILMTGFASLETAVQAIREGAYDYITKPFKLDEMKIIVNNAREKIRLIRENKKLIRELQNAYSQLHMMKNIIGMGEESSQKEEPPDTEIKGETPFIAGSMLPFYYTHTENNTDTGSLTLSDLERISALRERGFLTEEEYNLCKSRLLKNIKP